MWPKISMDGPDEHYHPRRSAGVSAITAAAVPVGKVTQARVALSGWTKLRSVRPTRW